METKYSQEARWKKKTNTQVNVKVPGIHLFLVISVAAVTPTSDTILKVLRNMVVSESREL